jgi:sec-independent protein translocase protein TatC
MSYGNHYQDPEDMFADTRMSFGDHLEELRLHMWRAIIGFGLILILTLALDGIGWATDTPIGVGVPVMKFMAKPVEDALTEFYKNRADKLRKDLSEKDPTATKLNEPREVKEEINVADWKEALGLPVQPGDEDKFAPVRKRIFPLETSLELQEAQYQVGRRPALSTLNVTEAMMVYFKVAIVCGIVLGSPWIFWQMWMFVAAGLYPHEKRYVHVYLPFSLGLFLAGVAVCELIVLPKAVAALLWFNEWLGLEPDMRLNEWLSFAIWLPVVFGVSFQTPLVMMFLERIGIWTIDTYRRKRRIAWFAMAVFAAVITPTPDIITMSFMWLPMCGLYELGILLCKMSPHEPDLDIDVPDREEMVEV